MKRKIIYCFALSTLIACGGNEETIEEEEVVEDTTAVEIVEEEPAPTSSEMAIGKWLIDVDARAEVMLEEDGTELSEEDKASMATMFENTYLELNENGTFEMVKARHDLDGTGLWEIAEDGSSITLTKDGAEPMEYAILLQTENQMRIRHEKTDGNHSSTINFEFYK